MVVMTASGSVGIWVFRRPSLGVWMLFNSWVERVEVAAANLFPFSPVQLIRYDHRLLFPLISL
jgi:NAD-dependent SIR2 family protein deacetylase